MTIKWMRIACVLFLLAATAEASTKSSNITLRLYGPGGPHHVLEECAALFRAQYGVDVVVTKVLPHDLERRLREDGDMYYGGAEYMLEDVVMKHPDLLDIMSAELLHPRRIGILVRKGNPHNIEGIADLAREEIALLDVKLENMRGFHGNPPDASGNIRHFVYTGQQGIDSWQTIPEIDAWITYRSWHALLDEHAEFIEIPGHQALRFTPVALTRHTPYRQKALQFIAFLKSEEARRIFLKHGWN